MKSGDYWIVL